MSATNKSSAKKNKPTAKKNKFTSKISRSQKKTRISKSSRARKQDQDRLLKWRLHVHRYKTHQLQTRKHNELCPRELLRASRNSERRADTRNHKIPWLTDAFYRYVPRLYKRASLLGLPTELRQQILELTFDGFLDGGLHQWQWDRASKWKMRDLHAWVGTLSCLCPLIRIDMQWVGRKWSDILVAQEKNRIESTSLYTEKMWDQMTEWERELMLRRQEDRKALEQRLGQPGAKNARKTPRYRPHKCWACNERHPQNDPVCPPSRRDPAKWKAMTRPSTKGRMNSLLQYIVPAGQKIVFND
ncbi:hypothetical protein BS50DRAFT_243913 [Corynespora cassiicola Philippines]|uniref:Uncharacterized protein n=1 Tax=Corynespora cassiicola Philippines TaxID=1448308 RepID=A0A2T2P3E8_CORCC|nr:hypothetical protein BS50DRAFT_243913 [Corynespora cassiicola Philippines]